jgi:1-acyl-sn-glycerol-3-phosphate acyltransferase
MLGEKSRHSRQTSMARKKDAPAQSRAREPEDLEAHIEKALALSGETDTSRLYRMLQFMFDPQLLHTERIDTTRPSLFVANHGLYGFDGGLLPCAIREKTGMLPRLLADSQLMLSPLGDTFMNLGLVLANRKVCAALMDAGESILVFPGGAREGAKRRGEQYKLFWEGRTGFVSLAIEHGFTITPVASVGPDEIWDIRWDSDDLKGTWFESLLRRAFPEGFDAGLMAPIPKGILGTLVPRPERFYVAFGEPFDTRPFAGGERDKKVLNKVQRAVKSQLEELIKEALLVRAQRSGEMHWLRRLLTRH